MRVFRFSAYKDTQRRRDNSFCSGGDTTLSLASSVRAPNWRHGVHSPPEPIQLGAGMPDSTGSTLMGHPPLSPAQESTPTRGILTVDMFFTSYTPLKNPLCGLKR